MGALGSRVSKQEIKTPHFFFGQVGKKNEFNKELIVVYKKLLRQDQYVEWERGYNQTNSMNRQSLFLAQSFEKQHIKKYFTCCECPADYEMSIVFERFDNLYKEQLAKRQSGSTKMVYKQEELFLILYQLAGGVKEFQLKGLKFGDIRPSQMIITTSTKKIKMINLYSYPWEITSLEKILDKYDNKTIFYLAPEEISFINSPSKSSNVPNPKTQAFSLGLSILQAALLQNSEDIYGVSPRTINMSMVNKRLEILEQKYPLLKKYLELLLKEKPQQRYSCGQLWSILKVYSQNITVIRKFNKDEGKEKTALQNFRKNNK